MPNPRCFQSSVLSLSIPKPSRRRAEDEDLKQRILRIFAEFKQRYGVMKIHHELNLELQPLQRRCSPRRISRLMKELDIHSVTVNKWKAASASKTKVEQRPNLLKQDFSTTGLNQKWTADMTYIQTKRNGWCYLSTIMDLHSRRIIGYSFSKKMATDLVLKTLESAVKNRTITGDLIIHTDLGSQYTSDDYNQRLTEQWNLFMLPSKRNVFIQCRSLRIMKLPLLSFLNMCMLSTIGREFIVHWATRPPYKLKSQHLRAKWPPDLMLSMVQISY
ncbi:IS3 family transposase [Limosilactobacillus fermentum]|nr:IS3 family transposase [Limosilactobacillus fermentum]